MQKVNKNLKIILDKFKQEVSKDQFRFSHMVTEFDTENNCGTICCIVGWFPKLFPNSGFIWVKDGNSIYHTIQTLNGGSIKGNLMDLIGTSSSCLINYLFYGKNYQYPNFTTKYKDRPKLSIDSTYDEVILAWEYMIQNYKEESMGSTKYSLS